MIRPDPAGARFALYWAPEVADPLHALGSAWLGRDAETGATLRQPAVPGLDLFEATRDPRGYGLHGTLKPPFRLAPGSTYAALRAASSALAARTRPFPLPPLRAQDYDGFLALRESAPAPDLYAFADDCVRAADAHRAPPSEAEVARRRPESLTERGREHLRRWGYPYVFEDFAFHVTLSRRLSAEEMRAALPAAEAHLGAAAGVARTVRELCLFSQAAPDAPFLVAERLPLGGAVV